MSWLTGIKAALSAPKIIEKGVDGVLAGIDKCFYTEEERAEAKQAAGKTLLKFWEMTTAENTEQSIARRVLAKMTFQVYFYLIIMGSLVYAFNESYAAFLFKVAGSITPLVLMVAAIYFGPHQVSKIWKKGG